MKLLSLIPFLFIASCASRPAPQILVRPLPPCPVEPVEDVRYAEVIRAYQVGRYEDPNHPGVMHEQHPLYRVEAHTRWNLKPGDSVAPGTRLLNPPPDAAHSTPPTNDVVLAELNRQKDVTERVMSEASQLARSYDELREVIQDMSSVAKDHSILNARLLNAEQRVAVFEQEFKNLMAAPAPPTNALPELLIEEPAARHP